MRQSLKNRVREKEKKKINVASEPLIKVPDSVSSKSDSIIMKFLIKNKDGNEKKKWKKTNKLIFSSLNFDSFVRWCCIRNSWLLYTYYYFLSSSIFGKRNDCVGGEQSKSWTRSYEYISTIANRLTRIVARFCNLSQFKSYKAKQWQNVFEFEMNNKQINKVNWDGEGDRDEWTK